MTAEKIMQKAVITVHPDMTLRELAKVFIDNGIHRLIITRDGKLCGIVTSIDILRGMFAKA